MPPDASDQPIVMRLREIRDRWTCLAGSDLGCFVESSDTLRNCAEVLDCLIREYDGRVIVDLSLSDAAWLDQWMQDEYKREGFRPHERRKPEVVEVGAAVQAAIEVTCGESA